MTVDSVYIPEVVECSDEDLEYPFELESVGAEAFRIYLVDENGSLTQLKLYESA